MDPNTPYANLAKLREQLFSTLSGDIKIVDKHFNSTAIANLHRLISDERGNLISIIVITSNEMLDSSFGDNYNDLKKELNNSNIDFQVKIMNKEDSGAQHERFIMDDRTAFKIPPFSIINKKSEHITKINIREAKKRFDYLFQRSVKYENFIVKEGSSA